MSEATAPVPRRLLTGHRDEAWRVDLLTLDDAPLGTLDGVEDGSFDYSIFDTIRSGGSLTVTGAAGVDWHRVRLQPWYTLTDPATGSAHAWPAGVFIPAAPKDQHSDTATTVAVELYDKLLVLDQDKVLTTYTVDAGTVVTAAVRELVLSAGEEKIALTDSTETLSVPMVWEAGTTKLRIINDLLAAINYLSLWVDGHGVFRADPYVDPQARPVRWEHVDDDESIHSPDFTHDADGFNVPNVVVCIASTDGEEEPAVATARNEDPASPWSYQSRGRWIVHVETDVDASSAEVLGQIAARRLVELSQVTSTFELEHAWLPQDLNDAVVLRNEKADIQTRCVVQKFSVSMGTGDLVTTTLRAVV